MEGGIAESNCYTPYVINRYINQNKLCNRACLEINSPEVVWRGRSPSKCNPQQRHARCEDEFLRSRAYQGLPARCSVRKSHRLFLRALTTPAGAKILSLRLCRPGFAAPGKQHSVLFSARTGRQALDSHRDDRQRRGGSRQGVLRARKTGLWPVFTEERAGRPWLCPPIEDVQLAGMNSRLLRKSTAVCSCASVRDWLAAPGFGESRNSIA